MKRHIFLLLIFIVISSFSAVANDARHIGESEGLSNQRTFCIEKDNTGFIWIATRSGIDRYDGVNIKNYLLLGKNSSSELTGRINLLQKDVSGNLWAFTNHGAVFKYEKEQDDFLLQFDIESFIPDKNPFLSGIYFFTDDLVFVYGSFGVWQYQISTKSFHEIKTFSSLSVVTITHLDGNKYAVATHKGLYIINLAISLTSTSEHVQNIIAKNERIQCVYYDRQDYSLILGTFGGKVLFYNMFNNSLEFSYETVSAIRDIISVNNIVYAATDGSGIICIDKTTKLLEQEKTEQLQKAFNKEILSAYNMLFDNNRLWIATYTDGVYKFDENPSQFKILRYNAESNSIASTSANSVLEDSSDNLWFGTGNGIYHYSVKAKQWQHILGSNGNAVQYRYNIMALCEDNKGNVWAGGHPRGEILCIDKNTLRIKDRFLLNETAENQRIGRIYVIFCDADGNLLIGGLHGQLVKYNPQTKAVKKYNISFVNAIYENELGLFVGTTQGFYKYRKSDDTFVELLPQKHNMPGMLIFINTIYAEKDSIIWLGTEGGLIKYDLNRDILKVYTNKDGLPSNSVYDILPDSRNRLWIAADRGLACFLPDQNKFMGFSADEGLPSTRFFPRASIKDHTGNIFLGTANGAVYFKPEAIDQIKIQSHLIFTEFSIFYNPVYPGQKKSPLKKNIDETSDIHLAYNQNTFSFKIASINFTNPHREHFEWQLENYDKSWVHQEDFHNAYYTNIPPGSYVFTVRSINNDNSEVIAERKIKIEIAPPFWKTIWARLIYWLIAFVLVWLIIQTIKSRIEKRTSIEKIHFFTNTAHELKTPITLIKGPLNKLQETNNMRAEDRMLLDLAAKNTEKLHNLVRQLFDFQRTSARSVKLMFSEVDVEKYIQNRLSFFVPVISEKKIDLRTEIKMKEPNVWFDVDKMDKILNNLLSNAVKYTPEGGRILINVKSNERVWIIEVIDNGIGIPKNLQKEIFKPFFRADNAVNTVESGTGIGLLHTKNLVQLHHGKIYFESAQDRGTKFTISFPIHYSHMNKKKTLIKIMENENSDMFTDDEPVESDIQHKPSIVIVEDNEEMRLFLKQILIDKFVIYESKNGIEALGLLKIINCELVISDVMMPVMDGYELCKQIKADHETSHIPVILLTVLNDKENIHKGYKFGADNYIVKPFETAVLRLTVENCIKSRQALRKNLMLPFGHESDEELQTNPLDKSFIDELTSIVDNNLTNPDFNIDELSREMAMSRSSLYNKLKILTGQSPNNFIRIIRLNRAAKMLKDGKYNVTEVAYSVGIGDVKYFSTAFKKQFGISPSKYNDKS